MIHKMSEQGSLNWFTKKAEASQPVQETVQSEYLHTENDSEECPTVESTINPTSYNVCANCERPIVKTAKFNFEKEDDSDDKDESDDSKSEKSEKDSKDEKDDKEDKGDKKEWVKPWEKVESAKKLTASYNVQDDNQHKNVTRYDSNQSNYGGSRMVAPGQFSMFDSIENQIAKIQPQEGEQIKTATAKKEMERKAAKEEESNVQAESLKDQMASLFTQVRQSHSGSKEVLGSGTMGVGATRISMFDGEGKMFDKEYQDAKSISKKASKERTQSIQNAKTEKDEWKTSDVTKAKDKSEDLVSKLSKILGKSFNLDS